MERPQRKRALLAVRHIHMACCSWLCCPLPLTGAETVAGKPILFEETSHTLAYHFRLFWSQHGGLPIFDYPLTQIFIEQGRPVQYLVH